MGPPQGFPTNPMQLWNKQLPPQQLQQLQSLQMLLGGLGNAPAGRMISPSLASPPPQPAADNRPILGGTQSG